jgi:hypothetical protein
LYKTEVVLKKLFISKSMNSLRMGVWSVGGSPDMTVMRKTVMFNMVEMPRVIFSPDSAGIRNTNLTNKKIETI